MLSHASNGLVSRGLPHSHNRLKSGAPAAVHSLRLPPPPSLPGCLWWATQIDLTPALSMQVQGRQPVGPGLCAPGHPAA